MTILIVMLVLFENLTPVCKFVCFSELYFLSYEISKELGGA